MPTDPFEVLGIARGATVDEIRAARRRLALHVHPDRGGDAAAMQAVNVAFDAAIAHATGRRPLEPLPQTTPKPPQDAGARGTGPGAPRSPRRSAGGVGWQVEHDSPSFTIDALPVEAFEALLVVTSWIGEVVVDDPPYLLEVHLTEPGECWCRLELLPDAGSTTVNLAVATVRGGEHPTAEEVRDVWVANLNSLGAPPP